MSDSAFLMSDIPCKFTVPTTSDWMNVYTWMYIGNEEEVNIDYESDNELDSKEIVHFHKSIISTYTP